MPDTSSGKQLERYIADYLANRNFTEITFTEFQATKNKNKTLVSNIPYISIYGSKCRTEFLLCFDNREIRIECKWQGVSGSVDEKFPYLYHNAAEIWEQDEIIIVLDGKGYKPKAFEWIKTAAEEKKYIDPKSNKVIKVYTILEFLNWVDNGMKHLSLS